MPQANYHLGDWFVEPSLQRITKAKQVRRLEPQLMDVLQVLAEEPGRVVTKEHLKKTVWAEVVITENVITRSISSLRKLLDDDPISPNYIETISKKGYRLIAQVRPESSRDTSQTFTIRLAAKPTILVSAVIVFILLGAFAIRNVFLPSTSNNAFHPLAISNSTTTEYWPAISPDGRFVAYGWKGISDDNWDIYAKLIGTETVLRLTDNTSTDLRARWSGDGNYIYFLRYENGGSTIYKKPVIGGTEIRVIDSPPFSFGDFDISPDGKWIAFNTRKDRDTPLQIVLISLETGNTRSLTSPAQGFNGDIHPRFSPSGNEVAFIREKNSSSMYLHTYSISEQKVEQASSNPVSINGFDWSQDGKSLIYSSDLAGVYKLYELNLDDNESILLKSGDYQMVMPRVAATGRIIYAKMRDNVNIWSFDRETQTARKWYATNDLNLNPIPSPDGTRVCFTKQKNSQFEIWVSYPDGTNAVPITNFSGQYLTSPCWSSDSEKIYFQGFIGGQTDIFSVEAKGGVVENLTNSKADEHTPFAISDRIFYSSNVDKKWHIWKMDIDGDNRLKVFDYEGNTPKLSTDASRIFYLKKSKLGIWKYDFETREEELIISEFHPMYQGAFTVADHGIFYFNAKSKKIEFYDFATQQSELVYQPQRRIPRLGTTLSFFPGHQLMLFTQVDENDADIMLLEEQPN